MIVLSTTVLDNNLVVATDLVNISNGDDLNKPENIRRIIANRFGIDEESLTIRSYSPFNNRFSFVWIGAVDGAYLCDCEIIAFWSVLK